MRTINQSCHYFGKMVLVVVEYSCCQQLLKLINISAAHRQAETRQNDLAIITQPSLEPVKIGANWQFFGKKVIYTC
ncbi:hypothetical protein [Microcystis sp. M061S2]|uniref:hypothetical protein n=1 Tax=Microcystis sp. M061S2 TaxID=2771171 RepID=UPI00258F956E|nr:hypothetical protein [Microcystis sp. M061S2]MCA2655174.1 hypothetical protein [Microcystis sp. M061S2]